MARHPASWATRPLSVRETIVPEESGHDGADHPAATGVVSQVAGQRDDDLPGNRGQSQHGDGDQERDESRRDGTDDQRHSRQDQHERDQSAAVRDVAERDDQDDAQGVAKLRQGDQRAGRARRDA